MPVDTGPSDNFLARMFKKKPKDIELPQETRRDPRLPAKKKEEDEPEEEGIFSKIAKKKKEVNPFDRFVSAVSKK
jgi:hypothetical protein